MREQQGFDQNVPTLTRRAGRKPAPSTGHYAGLHPDDMPRTRPHAAPRYDFTDDEPRTNTSSTRRYVGQASPRTVMRVTTHQGLPPIQRASRMQNTRTEPPVQPVAVPHGVPVPRSRHWLFYGGMVLLLMLVGWILLTVVGNWWNGLQDNWHYGYPCTAQYDENVGHGGISHFTVENLHGHILITEVVPDDPGKAKIYSGPTLAGADADLAPATLTFTDVNNDNVPDMILTVDNTKYTFVNNKDGSFHSQQGGNA